MNTDDFLLSNFPLGRIQIFFVFLVPNFLGDEFSAFPFFSRSGGVRRSVRAVAEGVDEEGVRGEHCDDPEDVREWTQEMREGGAEGAVRKNVREGGENEGMRESVREIAECGVQELAAGGGTFAST